MHWTQLVPQRIRGWLANPLIYLVILAALLRLPFIGQKSLNMDEWWGVIQSKPGLTYIFKEEWKIDIHPPLNFVFLHYWTKLSQADWFLRLPFSLFGILCVVAIYRLGTDLFGRRVGLLAALIMAVSPYAIFYSNYAKCYSLIVLLTILSLWMVWCGCWQNRFGYWIGVAALNTLGLYFHYAMGLVIAAQIAFLIATRSWRSTRWTWLVGAYAGTLLLFIPWMPIFLDQMRSQRDVALASPLARGLPIPFKLMYFFFSLSLGESVQPYNYLVVVPAAIVFGVAFLMGTVALLRAKERGYLILMALWVPIIVLILRPSFIVKHVNIAYPAFVLTIVMGLYAFPNLRVSQVFTLAVCLLSLYSVSNYHQNIQLHDSTMAVPWRQVAQNISNTAGASDAVLVFPENELFRYYYTGKAPLYTLSLDATQEQIAATLRRLERKKIWVLLVYSGAEHEQKRSWIRKMLKSYWTVQRQEKFAPDESLLAGLKAGKLRAFRYYALEVYRCFPKRHLSKGESPK